MINLDYEFDPMERAEQLLRAYQGLKSLLGKCEDFGAIDQDDLYYLFDILNQQMGASLRDAFKEPRRRLQIKAHRELKAAGATTCTPENCELCAAEASGHKPNHQLVS
jgi:hypothetical protein